MSLAAAKGLKPREAIDAAYAYFEQFLGDRAVKNILLEELEFDDSSGHWLVTIGFDTGRTSFKQPSVHGSLSLFDSDEVVPIREARRFYITDDGGALTKMERA